MMDVKEQFEKDFRESIDYFFGKLVDEYTHKNHPDGLPIDKFLELNAVAILSLSKVLRKNLLVEATATGDIKKGLDIIEAIGKDYEKQTESIEEYQEKLGELLSSSTENPC